jgi:PhoPQ-activated pathogenicity-related protein
VTLPTRAPSRSARAACAALVVSLAPWLALPKGAPHIVAPPAEETALDRYVAARDSVYGWTLVRTSDGDGYRGFVLELTSQTWRTAAEVDRPVWKHWLTIVEPEKATSRTAMLFIGGGSNNDPAPAAVNPRTVSYALDANTVVADLGMVPNQPLVFSDSKDNRRSEDDLIAYTRVKHFSTKDDTWLVRLAMVKSGVRAMDAIQEFLASEAGGRFAIDRFVVSGGSKRGWTTWLVGAVDPRVTAIMPTVIDALNSEAITRHHFEALGFFSSALDDYVRHGLFPHKIGTPEYRAVLAIEDPYNYRRRERLKMPKYLVNASGDQFFLPDNSQFYFNDLEGEKYLRYVPNARHNLAGSDARESLLAFYQAVLANTPRPRFSWTKEKDGSLRVAVTDKPRAVSLWQATNPKARDFRVDSIGNAYTESALAEQSPGVYVARVATPAAGFTAFFVELVYGTGRPHPFKFTTEVSVVPDTLPFKWEDARAKYPATKVDP